MKEYYTLSIEDTGQETQDKLNNLAEMGWKLICSYAYQGRWLIMERDRKEKEINKFMIMMKHGDCE